MDLSYKLRIIFKKPNGGKYNIIFDKTLLKTISKVWSWKKASDILIINLLDFNFDKRNKSPIHINLLLYIY